VTGDGDWRRIYKSEYNTDSSAAMTAMMSTGRSHGRDEEAAPVALAAGELVMVPGLG
jgi:hypothetical protein